MKVSNLTSPRSGAKVANQFIVNDGDIEYFQSYETVIAKRQGYNLTVSSAYNYSNTTSKYFRQWLTDEWRWDDSEVDKLKKMLKKANYGDKFYIEIGYVEYTVEYVDSL